VTCDLTYAPPLVYSSATLNIGSRGHFSIVVYIHTYIHTYIHIAGRCGVTFIIRSTDILLLMIYRSTALSSPKRATSGWRSALLSRCPKLALPPLQISREPCTLLTSRCVRVRVEIMRLPKCRNVGKSQSVLTIMINPIISTRTRSKVTFLAWLAGWLRHEARGL
jgi:hypothetical protein